MKSTLVCLVITLLAFSVQATEVEPKEIAELVQRSDHILICKVVKVEMLDSDDNEVIDRN